MKSFYGGTFLSKEDLEREGINYPIKVEYYKTKQLDENYSEVYGIEVVMTEYKEEVEVEKTELECVSSNEQETDELLNKFKDGQVTPISAPYVLEDFQKASNYSINL